MKKTFQSLVHTNRKGAMVSSGILFAVSAANASPAFMALTTGMFVFAYFSKDETPKTENDAHLKEYQLRNILS